MKIISLCLAFLFCINSNAQHSHGSRPNIVLILADDLGYNDLASYNNPVFKTTNLDKLAAAGLRFTQAYVAAPNCAPSRASLMTGMYTPKHGIYTVGSSERGKTENRKLIPVVNQNILDTSFYTIAEMLQQNGYNTAHIGKWHLGENNFGPEAQGFALNIGGNEKGSVGSHYNQYRKQLPGLNNEPDSLFLADALTNKAVNFITTQKDKPYFLYLPYFSVHTPVQAPANLITKYKSLLPKESPYSPAYAAMVENLDENIGKIIAAIDASANAENTIIIFISDNGSLLNYTTVDLRGEKGALYDGGIKVPLIINWPSKIKKAAIVNTPISSVDFFPTFAALAGVNTKQLSKKLDGINVLPVLEGKTIIDHPLVWHFPAYLESASKKSTDWRETPSSAIRYGSWKLVIHYETNLTELFDLNNDPKEQNNLAESNKKMVKKLKGLLDKYLVDTKAFIPTQINPAYVERKM